MNLKIFFGVLLLVILFLSACEDQGYPVAPKITPPDTTSTTDSVSFANDVRPIITLHNCASCHPGNGGFSVATYATISAGGSHGSTVIPGNGEGSNIVKKLRGTAAFGVRMPQGGPYLTDNEIQKISDWITQGALNN